MKLEINYKNKAGTIIHMCRLNNMLLNNYWVNEEVKEEIKRYIEINENEHTTIPKIWGCSKSDLIRGKFIAIQKKTSRKKKL